eukprot:gene2885-3175_t
MTSPLCLVLSACLAVGMAHAAAHADLLTFKSAAQDISQWLVSVRRELHQIPELMFEEHKTSAKLREYLLELDVPVQFPYAKTGLVGRIGKGKPIVALRADMDALPVLEPQGADYRSQHEGRMHACGHDAHMTMLLGAAKLLKQREAELQGTVLLVFQPAEEGGAGADVMVKEGAIPGASAMFGMHVAPFIPSGQVALRSGTIMAGSLTFKFTVTGRGGHAAMPHFNIDPVPAAAALIQALQVLVSRETSPLGSTVLSVTQLQGSDADNIIPDHVVLRGTLRALTHAHMMHIKHRIEEMVPAVVSAYRCNGSVDWLLEEHPYYPPTVNDPAAAAFVETTLGGLLGEKNAVPATMMFVGIQNETLGSVHSLHSPKFKLDESVLPIGAAVHATLAARYLAQKQEGFAEAPESFATSTKEEL